MMSWRLSVGSPPVKYAIEDQLAASQAVANSVQFTVSIFLERFVLSAFAGAVLILVLTNPMRFDWTQRITGAVGLLFLAYFAAHTAHLLNQKEESASQAHLTQTPLASDAKPVPEPPASATTSTTSNLPEDKVAAQFPKDQVYEGEWGKHSKGSPLRITDKPVVLEVALTPDKILKLKNHGFQYVTDLGISTSMYRFDPQEFAKGILKIEKWDKFGGGGFPRKVLAGHSETEPLSMGILRGFENFPADVRTDYFCFRLTFRDPRTEERYVIYRVTSAEKGGPSLLPEDLQSGEMGATNIKEKFTFMKGIAPLVAAHQDEFFNDGAKRYQP
jgi:hypothetical protein